MPHWPPAVPLDIIFRASRASCWAQVSTLDSSASRHPRVLASSAHSYRREMMQGEMAPRAVVVTSPTCLLPRASTNATTWDRLWGSHFSLPGRMKLSQNKAFAFARSHAQKHNPRTIQGDRRAGATLPATTTAMTSACCLRPLCTRPLACSPTDMSARK